MLDRVVCKCQPQTPNLSLPSLSSLVTISLFSNWWLCFCFVNKFICTKHLQTIISGEDLEKREPSYTVGGNVNCCSHYKEQYQFSSVQSLSLVQLFVTPWTAACQASLSITNSQSPPKPMSIVLVMPSNHLILCCPLLLPSIFPNIRVFSNESPFRIRWQKYWSFSFSISHSNEHPGLISFRMDWLDLLAVQGTLKSLLQYHRSKASIFQHSALFIVQLSHLYMTTGKTIALTRQNFVDKVMSLLFNMLYRLVITFFLRSKHLVISLLQSPSAVILETRKIKSATVSTVSPSIFHEVMGLDAMILVFWMLSFKPTFHSPLSLSWRGSLVLLRFLP